MVYWNEPWQRVWSTMNEEPSGRMETSRALETVNPLNPHSELQGLIYGGAPPEAVRWRERQRREVESNRIDKDTLSRKGGASTTKALHFQKDRYDPEELINIIDWNGAVGRFEDIVEEFSWLGVAKMPSTWVAGSPKRNRYWTRPGATILMISKYMDGPGGSGHLAVFCPTAINLERVTETVTMLIAHRQCLPFFCVKVILRCTQDNIWEAEAELQKADNSLMLMMKSATENPCAVCGRRCPNNPVDLGGVWAKCRRCNPLFLCP